MHLVQRSRSKNIGSKSSFKLYGLNYISKYQIAKLDDFTSLNGGNYGNINKYIMIIPKTKDL